MAISYTVIKAAAIEVVDDFSRLEITLGYGNKYKAKTKLAKIGVSAPALAMMPTRFNKVMKGLLGHSWLFVGPFDLVACETIGDVILLACGQGHVTLPEGEPT